MKLTDEQRKVLQDHWRSLVSKSSTLITDVESILLDIIQIILKGETS